MSDVGDGMSKVQSVTSDEFVIDFDRWSSSAQSAPIAVTDGVTGIVKGYFVSAGEFGHFMRVRDMLPKSRYAWEMSSEMAAELEKPLPRNYPRKGGGPRK